MTTERCVLLLFLALVASGCQQCGSTSLPSSAPPEPTALDLVPVKAKGLHNVFRITDKLYSGNGPDGDEGFQSLQNLGIKTAAL